MRRARGKRPLDRLRLLDRTACRAIEDIRAHEFERSLSWPEQSQALNASAVVREPAHISPLPT